MKRQLGPLGAAAASGRLRAESVAPPSHTCGYGCVFLCMTTFEERDRETADLVLVALGGDGAPAAVAAEVAHVLERRGLPAVLPPPEDGQEQEPTPTRGWFVPPYLSRTDGPLLDALARVLRDEPQWDADTVFRLWLLVVARRPGVARPRASLATSVVDPGDELLAA